MKIILSEHLNKLIIRVKKAGQKIIARLHKETGKRRRITTFQKGERVSKRA